jgi:hypothetical protein
MGHDACVVDCVRDGVLFAVPEPIEWQRIGKSDRRRVYLCADGLGIRGWNAQCLTAAIS